MIVVPRTTFNKKSAYIITVRAEVSAPLSMAVCHPEGYFFLYIAYTGDKET